MYTITHFLYFQSNGKSYLIYNIISCIMTTDTVVGTCPFKKSSYYDDLII